MIKLDPNWAAGYSELGIVNIACYWNGWSSSPDKCIRDALEYTNKALSLDADLPEAYSTLSVICLFKRQYDKAISEAERAIAVQPNYYFGYYMLGNVLVYLGRPKEAEEMYKKAIRLSPKQSYVKLYLGIAYLDSEKYSEAINAIKTFIFDSPDNIYGLVHLLVAYSLMDLKEEARKQAQEILRIDPKFSIESFALQIPYKNQSDTDRILNALRKAGLK